MSILDNTIFHLCKKLIRKKVWSKRLYSSRQMHRDVNGYTPACFPQSKLFRHQSSILRKAFWKTIFATRDIKRRMSFR